MSQSQQKARCKYAGKCLSLAWIGGAKALRTSHAYTLIRIECPLGGMVDTRDLKSLASNSVPVRVRERAPKGKRMRRGKPHSVEDYVRVRLEFLREERNKNDNETAHLIIDKSIFELSIILEMLTRT